MLPEPSLLAHRWRDEGHPASLTAQPGFPSVSQAPPAAHLLRIKCQWHSLSTRSLDHPFQNPLGAHPSLGRWPPPPSRSRLSQTPAGHTPEAPPHLDTRLRQLGPLRQLLAGVDVRVVSPLEGLLQLLQLLSRERGPTATLLTLQREVRLRLHVRALVQPVPYSRARGQEREGT